MAAITKTRKLEKRPKTKKFPFSRPGTKLYPTNSKRVYSRTVTLFSTCKVLYQFSFRDSATLTNQRFSLLTFSLFVFQERLPRFLDPATTVTDVRLHLSQQPHEKTLRQDFLHGESQSLRW